MTIINPERADTGRVEIKVKWGAIGGALGAVLLPILAAVLTPENEVISGLPDFVWVILTGLVPGIVALGAGYKARHTWRVKPGAQGGPTGSTEVG